MSETKTTRPLWREVFRNYKINTSINTINFVNNLHTPFPFFPLE